MTTKRKARGRRKCHYCDAPATTWDHIVPKRLGGCSERINLVRSCKKCNQEKAGAWPTCGCFVCELARMHFAAHEPFRAAMYR